MKWKIAIIHQIKKESEEDASTDDENEKSDKNNKNQDSSFI